MPLLDSLCRNYQRLFPQSHPAEAQLNRLHNSDDKSAFLQRYFEHEYEKGKLMVERFSSITTKWHNGRILDFGCGAGGLTFRVRELCHEAIGIDLDPSKLEFASQEAIRRHVGQIEFICYPGEEIPLPDRSFDCIFCVDVVEHLPNLQKFVQDFKRLLKPDGLLLISFGPPWGHPHGKHMWTKFPGWWTHLIFPSRVVMSVGGFSPGTTYEDLGMFRLTVRKFETIMAQSGLKCVYQENKINFYLRPLMYLPIVRGLFISEVVGVYSNQTETNKSD